MSHSPTSFPPLAFDGLLNINELFGIDTVPSMDVPESTQMRVPSSPSSNLFSTGEDAHDMEIFRAIMNDEISKPPQQDFSQSNDFDMHSEMLDDEHHEIADFASPTGALATHGDISVPDVFDEADEAKPRIDGEGEFQVVCPANCKPLYQPPKDVTERALQRIFPEWTLRLKRNDFNNWKKKKGIRRLTPKENERLKLYRRTMLARVYADRARQRRQTKQGQAQSAISQLQQENAQYKNENATLRSRIVELERILGR